ncbi:hypothetical protein U1Q18_035143 [Sarracenia purpurea var. burkii]
MKSDLRRRAEALASRGGGEKRRWQAEAAASTCGGDFEEGEAQGNGRAAGLGRRREEAVASRGGDEHRRWRFRGRGGAREGGGQPVGA